MKLKLLTFALFIGMVITLSSFDLPAGWFKAGSVPKSYEMGIDKGAGYSPVGMGNGVRNAATIKSIDKKISGFGTLMQDCLPDKYLGKRVRMSGYMKSKDVEEWAGFWFRVDQANSQESLSFDNMQDRAIKGTTDWKRYDIVLDVPAKASNLAYGALLAGTGQIWFSDLKFEIVENSVPATDKSKNNMPLTEPANLDFAK